MRSDGLASEEPRHLEEIADPVDVARKLGKQESQSPIGGKRLAKRVFERIHRRLLPGLRGCELAARLVAEQPGLGVVFTSGYDDDDRLIDRFPGSTFLQKPFTLQELSAAVAAAVR